MCGFMDNEKALPHAAPSLTAGLSWGLVLHPQSRPTIKIAPVKFTEYFHNVRLRPDRAFIELEWIQRVIDYPAEEDAQADGRIRRWAPIPELDGRYLRVVLLPDGETVHNAFFDSSFKP